MDVCIDNARQDVEAVGIELICRANAERKTYGGDPAVLNPNVRVQKARRGETLSVSYD
jgi:hypothetical protein